ncbi:MetS family NSS transporter small subunit [candidate division WOR-3 bacterium]|nr:MetS family NSS transporter small subunit [candidate division WOR-3 bacterium]
MPISAIVMLVVGCAVIYGGLAYCLSRTIKKKGQSMKGGD